MQHDAAIIGGGPAACAAALTLRSLGRSVCVIAAPGQKDRPTETAVPGLGNLLRLLGVPEALTACEPCYGIVSAWGRSSPAIQSTVYTPHGHAWFVHRDRFDATLCQAVCASGAEWHVQEAHGFERDQNGVTIFTFAGTLRARWVVLATGSPVLAANFTSQRANQFDSMIAFWAHLPITCEERLLYVEPADSGWWYQCPANPSGAFACFVTDATTARNLRPSEPHKWNALFRQTGLYRTLPSDAAASVVHVALTGLATLPQTHGPSWIAVGDAAAKLDPLGSAGLATALDSGRRAANAVADRLQGNNASLDDYARWNAGLVTGFTRQRRQQYALEIARHTAGFWTRRASLGS